MRPTKNLTKIKAEADYLFKKHEKALHVIKGYGGYFIADSKTYQDELKEFCDDKTVYMELIYTTSHLFKTTFRKFKKAKETADKKREVFNSVWHVVRNDELNRYIVVHEDYFKIKKAESLYKTAAVDLSDLNETMKESGLNR